MESKDLTIAMLTQERPDLVAGLKSEGDKEGCAKERKRCLSIVRTANKEFAGMGMDTIVDEAIENGKTEDATLAAMRGKRLEDIKAKAPAAPGPDAAAQSAVKKTHLERAKEYQQEHKCSITDALKATAEKRQK